MARLKKPVSFAFSDDTIALIDELANNLALSKSQVIELALAELKKRNLKPEQIIKTVTISAID